MTTNCSYNIIRGKFVGHSWSFVFRNRSSEVGSTCRSFAGPSSEVGSPCRGSAGPSSEVGSPCRSFAGRSTEVGSPCRGFAGRSTEVGSTCRSLAGRSSEVGSLIYTGGGRPQSKGLDFVRPFSRSADLERARLCPRLIKWFLRPSGSKRPFGVERDMLFILSGFLFYGVREKRRAVPSAVAFGAALSVGAVRAGVRRARGISDGSENRPLIHESFE